MTTRPSNKNLSVAVCQCIGLSTYEVTLFTILCVVESIITVFVYWQKSAQVRYTEPIDLLSKSCALGALSDFGIDRKKITVH